MARQRHLNNAPVVEAVIDIRVKNPSSVEVADLLSLKETLKGDYPDVKDRRLIEFGSKIEGKQIEQSLQDKGIDAYLFKSADGKNVVRFGIDGFAFSRLKPYTEWETVLKEARRLWGFYSSRVMPELITRIAVRYINQLELKLPIENFNRYLKAPPQIPKSLPQEISQFLTRVAIHEEDATANIVQAMAASPEPDRIRIILDIDVFKIKQAGFNNENMWSEFGKLRKLKNRIFFNSITEETARLFQ